MKSKNKFTVEATASNGEATSGRISTTLNGERTEIPAVIFSKSEIERLFEMLKTPQQTDETDINHKTIGSWKDIINFFIFKW